ncbi:MAG: DUF481 domain-containing protein [Endomicrobium sp.]|nr:DUF481 domain-containing protein [Endomicrobium sp.]
MKKIFLFFSLFFASANVSAPQAAQSSAQSVKWKTSGILTWAYNQTAVSGNWTGKEKFTRGWQTKLFISAERNSEKTAWLTTFKEEYGETEALGKNSISLDMIEFNTVWTYKIYRQLQPYASFYTLTQNNKFWDPITYVESAGLNFNVLENAINTLKVRAGYALKQVDDSIKGNTRDMGAEVVLSYSLLFHKSAKFISEARLYETFKNGQDLKWENKLFLKTGPWFTTEIGYSLYFDNSRIPAHSWPNDIESITYVALGFSFNMFE